MKNLIQHIRNYVPLSDSEAERIIEEVQLKTLKKKKLLIREGDVCKYNFFVSEGCLRMYFIKENGTEQITQFAIENWWISDYMSMMKQQPSTFYIQAIEDSRVIQLSTGGAERLFNELPQLERYFRLVMQHAYAASQFRIKFLYDLSREELYHHFSSQFPDFVQRVPQYMLASFLGFTPEYLSEIRKRK
jgi:CRP/FNR family transcriptional regulator, anaerobic regulatory protein